MRKVNIKRIRIAITTSEQVQRHLQTLVSTGLYGATVPEAAEQVLCEALRQTLKRKQTKLLEEI